MTKLSIIIPTYNEADTLPTLIKLVESANLGQITKEIIVVDDGSTDATEAAAQFFSPHIQYIRHAKNQGKSGAIRTGLQSASGDYVVIQDADLEYDPNDLKILLEKAVTQELPAVYGSRNYHAPFWKTGAGRLDFLLGGILVTLFTNVLYNKRLTDEPTCYKLIRRDIINTLSLTEERFAFCPEVTAKLFRLGHQITEVPISYSPRDISAGKKIRYKDGFHALYVLTKYRVVSPKQWHKPNEQNQ